MVPQGENFESVSVNIHEAGSFTNFNERDPDTNFFDDINKQNKEKTVPSLKNLMSCMSIFEVLNVILKI